MQTSVRTNAKDSFYTQVEAGVCDIQYIFCNNMVSVVVMMCDRTLSSRLYQQSTHRVHARWFIQGSHALVNFKFKDISRTFQVHYPQIQGRNVGTHLKWEQGHIMSPCKIYCYSFHASNDYAKKNFFCIYFWPCDRSDILFVVFLFCIDLKNIRYILYCILKWSDINFCMDFIEKSLGSCNHKF